MTTFHPTCEQNDNKRRFLLLSLELQSPTCFNLLSEFLQFYSFLALLSPPFYPYYFHVFFNIYDPSLS